MDAAFQYDHIASQNYDRAQTPISASDPNGDPSGESSVNDSVGDAAGEVKTTAPPRTNLQDEFKETFKAFSNSPWGATLGGLWGNVRKQGESYYKTGNSYYEEARREVGGLGADAMKEIEGLRNKVANVDLSYVAGRGRSGTVKQADVQAEGEPNSMDKDNSLQKNDTIIERFKTEAAKRLREVQKAEDATDEALERFGMNIRNFLRDAVTVTAPNPREPGQSTEVLFESKDVFTGKRVIHTSRFDAQLHVIHTTLTSFIENPDADTEFADFKKSFDIEYKTADIAGDLEKYAELRNAMEKLVPEQVEYKDFWTRYYFLRHVVELQEEKRRELLQASANEDEEIAWDEDSDSESEMRKNRDTRKIGAQKNNGSTSTLQPPSASDSTHLSQPRRSHDEKSVADSEASYDLVSAATTGTPGSPRDAKTKTEDSDEEDWE